MAFASPDPKRVEADKARIRQRHLDDVAEIQKQKRIAFEIRECYSDHTPAQVAKAHDMIACNDAVGRIKQAENAGIVMWERIGVSRGGKQRKNLYRCMVL